eukprot:7311258-Prymnesium_polylepis.1
MTQVYLEFNHLYRWHALVADALDFGGGAKVAFADLLWDPTTFRTHGVRGIAGALHRTRAAALTPRNTPAYLRNITVSSIEDERTQRMRSFNDYRAHFGLKRLESFADFGTSPEISAALAALYPTVDDVDFFVGIMVEQIFEDPTTSGFSEGMTQMVGAFALSAILNFIHVRDPALSSVERLSQAGADYLKDASLRALLSKHAGLEAQLPCGTPLLVPEAPGASLCPSDFIDKPEGWGFNNIFDF